MSEGADWLTWFGGACPVKGDCWVEARRRYAPAVTDRADRLAWHHDLYVGYGANDIVAYRLTGPDEV